MNFALDSDTCIEILRSRYPTLISRYRAIEPTRTFVPSIVAGELMTGALKSTRSNAVSDLEGFLNRHAILPFGDSEFRIYARIRVGLEARGLKIGPNDLIVAATALAVGATLVTHNVREFARVPGLTLVDWWAET